MDVNLQRSLYTAALILAGIFLPTCLAAQQQAVTPEGTMTNSRQAAGPPTPLQTFPAVSSGKSPEVLRQEHAALVADADKLSALVADLKTELLATNGMTLSVGAARKAEEIEKLARSMKKRLKT